MRKRHLKKFAVVSLTLIAIFFSIPSNLCAVVIEEDTNITPKEEEKAPQYAPGEVLVKFKEGANPETVLQETNIKANAVERVHSITPVVAQYKNKMKLEADKLEGKSGSWYWYKGKKYSESDFLYVPDEEIFLDACKDIAPEEKALYNIYKITLPEETDIGVIVEQLEKDPNVEYAQPNYKYELQAVPLPSENMIPNDYYLANGSSWREASWGQGYPDMWGLQKIQAVEAWNVFDENQNGIIDENEKLPGEGVVVAVIDTGLDYNHPDIQGNVWVNEDEIPNNGIDDDGNGYIDDYRGYDFSDNDSDVMDNYGHGSHCAGTIAAKGNNEIGVIGVAYGAKIMPVKIFPHAYSDVIVQAMHYAADNGAKVLSNSWGPSFRQTTDPTLESAFEYAYGRGCVVVFAAGNDDDDTEYYVTANNIYTIAIGSSDHNDKRSGFSNYGNEIDVIAPGGDYRGWVYERDLHALGGGYYTTKWPGNFCIVDDIYVSDGWDGFIYLITCTGPDRGILDIAGFGGGGSLEPIDLYSPKETWQATIPIEYTIDNATCIMTVSDICNPMSADTNVVIDGMMLEGYEHFDMQFGTSTLYRIDSNILSLRSNNNGKPTGLSTYAVEGQYYRMRGTSMACPHVSGLAALILSAHPEFNNEQIRQAIRCSTDDVEETGWDVNSGYGRINAYKAIQIDSICEAKIEEALINEDSPKVADITYTAKGPNLSSYILEYSTEYNPDRWIEIERGSGPAGTEHRSISLILPVCSGKVFISLQAMDGSSGLMSEDKVALKCSTMHIEYPGPSYLIADKNVDIKGTIAGCDFISYTLECSSLGIIAGPSSAEVENGVLGTIDGSLLTEGQDYTITLRAQTENGERTASVNISMIANMLQGWPVHLISEYEGAIISLPMRGGQPVVGDIDNDGYLEAVVCRTRYLPDGDIIEVYRHDGTLHPGWPRFCEQYVLIDYKKVILADVNNDDKLEIIAGEVISPFNHVEGIHIWLENGERLPNWPQAIADEHCSDVVSADLDGDGCLEIIALTRNETYARIYAWHSDGSKIFDRIINAPTHMNGYDEPSIAIGDIVGDESKEIIYPVISDTSGSVQKLIMLDSTGSIIYSWPFADTDEFSNPVLGDMDNDGDLEIAITGQNHFLHNGKVYVFHGDGSMANGWPKEINGIIHSNCLADFEKDGRLELIVCTRKCYYGDENLITVFDHLGNVMDGWPIYFGEYGSGMYDDPAIGDIDGDRNPDIIVYQQYYNYVEPKPEVWNMLHAWDKNGNALEGYPKTNYFGGSVLITDLNNDGDIDILTFGYHDTNSSDNDIPYYYATIYVYTFPYAYDKTTMHWPMYRHDPQHTSCYVPLNNRPILTLPFDTKTTYPYQTVAFTLSATDPDGDTITYRAENMPQMATFNTSTGQFSWRPYPNQAGEYNITFRAMDEHGLKSQPQILHITVITPTLILQAPPSPLMGTVTFNITGTDLANFTRFYISCDNTYVGYVTTPQFSVNTLLYANCSHTFKVFGVHQPTARYVYSNPVTVQIQNPLPTPVITITNLVPNQTVNGIYTIKATTNDNANFQYLAAFIDSRQVGIVDYSYPYTFNWYTQYFTNTSHTVTIKGYYKPKYTWITKTITINVNNPTPPIIPTLTITTQPGQTLSGTKTITVTSNDANLNGVVLLYVDNTYSARSRTNTYSPFNVPLITTRYPNGTHKLRAYIYHALMGSYVYSGEVVVTIQN